MNPSSDKPLGVHGHSDWHQQAPIHETMQKIREAIWRRRPILGDIMKKHGGETLYDYSRDFMDVNPTPALDGRKSELVGMVKNLLSKRLDSTVAEKVAKQLTKIPLVSTADHHGPIDHPFWVNSNIISALPYMETTDVDLSHLVVFSFASVSVNNASAYPRGVLFHGGENGSGQLIRLPVLPDRLKMGVVYGMRPFTREDLTKAEGEILKKEKNGEIESGRGTRIKEIVEKYFGDPDVLAAPDLATQITKINYRMWPNLFHTAKHSDQKMAVKMPDLIYLEIETLVTELLMKHHLNDSNSLVYKLFFAARYRDLMLKYFNNIPGAFSTEKDWGTHHFWGVDEKWHRVRLTLDGDMLRSTEGGIAIPFTPEGVRKALEEKKIFPSMITCYLLVSLYYGMKCLGGFCQVNDLTMAKKAWQDLLREAGESAEAEAVEPIQTKELGGDGMVLSYLKTPSGDLVPATGIDMILEEPDTTFDGYIELSKKVTLSDMMNPMLPEMYTVLYPITDRDPELTALTPEMIMKTVSLRSTLEEKINHDLAEEQVLKQKAAVKQPQPF